jgi:tripartite-type tricarboxylate transporter receptor subunit TctC
VQRSIASLFAALALVALGARAQDYPTKPIRVLVPFAPGGVVDTSTRILTNKLSERLGWTFVVDNRPGGNGFIAVGLAAKAPPDGYTLLSARRAAAARFRWSAAWRRRRACRIAQASRCWTRSSAPGD